MPRLCTLGTPLGTFTATVVFVVFLTACPVLAQEGVLSGTGDTDGGVEFSWEGDLCHSNGTCAMDDALCPFKQVTLWFEQCMPVPSPDAASALLTTYSDTERTTDAWYDDESCSSTPTLTSTIDLHTCDVLNSLGSSTPTLAIVSPIFGQCNSAPSELFAHAPVQLTVYYGVKVEGYTFLPTDVCVPSESPGQSVVHTCTADNAMKKVEFEGTDCDLNRVIDVSVHDSCSEIAPGWTVCPSCDSMFHCTNFADMNIDWNRDGDTTNDYRNVSAVEVEDNNGCPFSGTDPSSPCNAAACHADGSSSACYDVLRSYCTDAATNDAGCDDIFSGCDYTNRVPTNPCISDACINDHSSSACTSAVEAYCSSETTSSDPGCDDDGEDGCPFSSTNPSSPCNAAACHADHTSSACYDVLRSYCTNSTTDDDAGCDDVFSGCDYTNRVPTNPCISDACINDHSSSACAAAAEAYCSSETTSSDPGCDGNGEDGCPFSSTEPSSPCNAAACHADHTSSACYDVLRSYCTNASTNDAGCDDIFTSCNYTNRVLTNPCISDACINDHSSSACAAAAEAYCSSETTSSDPGCDDGDEIHCWFSATDPSSPCNAAACHADHTSTACYDVLRSYCTDAATNDAGCDHIFNSCDFSHRVPTNPCLSDACTRDNKSAACSTPTEAYCSAYPADCISCEFNSTDVCVACDSNSDSLECREHIASFCTSTPADAGCTQLLTHCPFTTLTATNPCLRSACQEDDTSAACHIIADDFCTAQGDNPDAACTELCRFDPSDDPASPCQNGACGTDPLSPECVLGTFSWCSSSAGSDDSGCSRALAACPYKNWNENNPCFTPACEDASDSDDEDAIEACRRQTVRYCTSPGSEGEEACFEICPLEHRIGTPERDSPCTPCVFSTNCRASIVSFCNSTTEQDSGCDRFLDNCPFDEFVVSNPCIFDSCYGTDLTNNECQEDIALACNGYSAFDMTGQECFTNVSCPFSPPLDDWNAPAADQLPCRKAACQANVHSSSCAQQVASFCNSPAGESNSFACTRWRDLWDGDETDSCPFRQTDSTNPCYHSACRGSSQSSACASVISSFCALEENQWEVGCRSICAFTFRYKPDESYPAGHPCNATACQPTATDPDRDDNPACLQVVKNYCTGLSSSLDSGCTDFIRECKYPFSNKVPENPCFGDSHCLTSAPENSTGDPVAPVNNTCGRMYCNSIASAYEPACDKPLCWYSFYSSSVANPCDTEACKVDLESADCLAAARAFCTDPEAEGARNSTCRLGHLRGCPFDNVVASNPCFYADCRANPSSHSCTARYSAYCNSAASNGDEGCSQLSSSSPGGPGTLESSSSAMDFYVRFSFRPANESASCSESACSLDSPSCPFHQVEFVHHREDCFNAYNLGRGSDIEFLTSQGVESWSWIDHNDCPTSQNRRPNFQRDHAFGRCDATSFDADVVVPTVGVCQSASANLPGRTTRIVRFRSFLKGNDSSPTCDDEDKARGSLYLPTDVCVAVGSDDDASATGRVMTCNSDGTVKVATYSSSQCQPSQLLNVTRLSNECHDQHILYFQYDCPDVRCKDLSAIGVDWNLDGDPSNDDRDIGSLPYDGEECPFSSGVGSPCRANVCEDVEEDTLTPECIAVIVPWCRNEQHASDDGCRGLANSIVPSAPTIDEVDPRITTNGTFHATVTVSSETFPVVASFRVEFTTDAEAGIWTSVENNGVRVLDIGDLEPDTTYYVRAFAINPTGTSEPSAVVSFVSSANRPSPPRNLRKLPELPDEPCCVTLAWDVPEQTDLITGYVCLVSSDYLDVFWPGQEHPSTGLVPLTGILSMDTLQVEIELPQPLYDYNLTCVSVGRAGQSVPAEFVSETGGFSTPPSVSGSLKPVYYTAIGGTPTISLQPLRDVTIRSIIEVTSVKVFRCARLRTATGACSSFDDQSPDWIEKGLGSSGVIKDTALEEGLVYVYALRVANLFGATVAVSETALGIPPLAPEGNVQWSVAALTTSSVDVCWDISEFEQHVDSVRVVMWTVTEAEGSRSFALGMSLVMGTSSTCLTFGFDSPTLAFAAQVISGNRVSELPRHEDDYFYVEQPSEVLQLVSAVAEGLSGGSAEFEVGDAIRCTFSGPTNMPALNTSVVLSVDGDATYSAHWVSSVELVLNVTAVGSEAPQPGIASVAFTGAPIELADATVSVPFSGAAFLRGNFGSGSQAAQAYAVGTTVFSTPQDTPVQLTGLLSNIDLDGSDLIALSLGVLPDSSVGGTFNPSTMQITSSTTLFPTFTPTSKQSGMVVFEVNITTGGETETVRASIEVVNRNDAPEFVSPFGQVPLTVSSIVPGRVFYNAWGLDRVVNDPDGGTLDCRVRFDGATVTVDEDAIGESDVELSSTSSAVRVVAPLDLLSTGLSAVYAQAPPGRSSVSVLFACTDDTGLQRVERLAATVSDAGVACMVVDAAQVVGAVLSDTGSSAVVELDVDIAPAFTPLVTCSVFDNSTQAKLGSLSICFWGKMLVAGSVRRGVIVYPSPDSTLAVGDSLGLAADNAAKRCAGGAPATGSAVLERSPNAVLPSIQLVGPSSIDVCQSFELTVRVDGVSSGYRTQCVGPVDLAPDQVAYVVAPASLEVNTTHTFTCTVTTRFGESASSSLSVRKVDTSAPRVVMYTPSVTVRPRFVRRWALEASASFSSCGSRSALEYSWSCNFSSSASPDRPRYEFYTWEVPVGTTWCTLTVCATGDSSRCTNATATVTRVPSPLTVTTLGPSVVPEDLGSFSISAALRDPDVLTVEESDYSWAWTCTDLSSSTPCVDESTGQVLDLSNATSLLRLETSRLPSLATLQFEVTVSQIDRQATVSHLVFLDEATEQPTPLFQLRSFLLTDGVLIEAVFFAQQGVSRSDLQAYTFAWELVGYANLTSSDRFAWLIPMRKLRDELAPEEATDDAHINSVTRPSVLATELTFRATVTNEDGGMTTNEISVVTLGPPSGCTVEIINLEQAAAGEPTSGGEGFKTDFVIEVQGCSVDGSSNGIRGYRFFSVVNDDVVLLGVSASSSITRRLPAGDVKIVAVVQDERRAEAGFAAEITVAPPSDVLAEARAFIDEVASDAELTRSADDVIKQASATLSVLRLLDGVAGSEAEQSKSDIADALVSSISEFAEQLEPGDVAGFCVRAAQASAQSLLAALDMYVSEYGPGDFADVLLSGEGDFRELLDLFLESLLPSDKRVARAASDEDSDDAEHVLDLLDQSFVDTLGTDEDSPVGTKGEVAGSNVIGRYVRIGQQRGVDMDFVFDTATVALGSLDQTASPQWEDVDVRVFVFPVNPFGAAVVGDTAVAYRLDAVPSRGQSVEPVPLLNTTEPVTVTLDVGVACGAVTAKCTCRLWDRADNEWKEDARLDLELDGSEAVCVLDLSQSGNEAHEFVVAVVDGQKVETAEDDDDEFKVSDLVDRPLLLGGAVVLLVLLCAAAWFCTQARARAKQASGESSVQLARTGGPSSTTSSGLGLHERATGVGEV